MTPYLRTISEGAALSRSEAAEAMHLLLKGAAEPEQIAGFLLGLRSRGETIDELTGFTEVMRSYAVPVNLDDPHAIDVVGTGGDTAGTFNISTAAAFVCAGAGIRVAKHGNRAVSSKSGSADVLAALGIKTDLRKEGVEKCLEEAGISFIFAPFFHPALKNVMPIRRKLGVRTFFNILGPLCNPAGVQRLLVGAFDRKTAQQMAHILHGLGAQHALAVHGSDGLDEITLTGPTHFFEVKAGSDGLEERLFEPEDLGFKRVNGEALLGGDAKANAEAMRAVFSGRPGPIRNIVVLNAAFGLYVSGRFAGLEAAVQAAKESIDSGHAREKLEKLAEISWTAEGA